MKKLMLLVLAVMMLVGCSGTKQTGFLGDPSQYKKLQEDPTLDGAMIWRKPDMGLIAAHYDKVIVPPIQLWLPEQMAEESDIELEELQALPVVFKEALEKELGDAYPVVETPGPRVAHLEIAITDVQESAKVMNAITSVIPIGVLVSFTKKAVTGEHANVGAVSIEAVVRDSMTGEVVAMFTDRKSGDKYSSDNYKKLGQAKAAIQEWAETMRKRFDEAHKVEPKKEKKSSTY